MTPDGSGHPAEQKGSSTQALDQFGPKILSGCRMWWRGKGNRHCGFPRSIREVTFVWGSRQRSRVHVQPHKCGWDGRAQDETPEVLARLREAINAPTGVCETLCEYPVRGCQSTTTTATVTNHGRNTCFDQARRPGQSVLRVRTLAPMVLTRRALPERRSAARITSIRL